MSYAMLQKQINIIIMKLVEMWWRQELPICLQINIQLDFLSIKKKPKLSPVLAACQLIKLHISDLEESHLPVSYSDCLSVMPGDDALHGCLLQILPSAHPKESTKSFQLLSVADLCHVCLDSWHFTNTTINITSVKAMTLLWHNFTNITFTTFC